jgi:hypothetical protein
MPVTSARKRLNANASRTIRFDVDTDSDDEISVVDVDDQPRLSNAERRKQIKKNTKRELRAGVADGAILGIIFSMFLTNFTHALLDAAFKYILFSAAAGANIALSIYAWREAHLNGYKHGTKVKAIMQTLFTIPITIAVAGSLLLPLFVPTTVFAAIHAPIIFGVTLGVKFLYQTASAIYYHGKSTGVEWVQHQNGFNDRETNEFKKAKYEMTAKSNLVFALSTALAVTAILSVFLFLHTAVAPVGIIAGMIGAGFTFMLLRKTVSVNNEVVEAIDNNNNYDAVDNAELDMTNENRYKHVQNRASQFTISDESNADDKDDTLSNDDEVEIDRNDNSSNSDPDEVDKEFSQNAPPLLSSVVANQNSTQAIRKSLLSPHSQRAVLGENAETGNTSLPSTHSIPYPTQSAALGSNLSLLQAKNNLNPDATTATADQANSNTYPRHHTNN